MPAKKDHDDDAQKRLPFEEAEGNQAERRARLLNAVALANGDLQLREFLIWIFNTTHGGRPGERLYKSYPELAMRPLGLCCSVSKARNTVAEALHLGLVDYEEERGASGSQKPNGYWIDWAGVTEFLGYNRRRLRAGEGPSADAPRRQPPVSTEQPPVSTEQPPVSTEQHIKEDSRLPPVFDPSSQAGQARRPDPFDSTAAGASAGRWDASARARVREAIAAIGYKRFDSLSHEAEVTLAMPAQEVLALCEEYRANRSKFAGPGALAYRLRERDWPTEGVLPAAKQHALAAGRKQYETRARLEGELFSLIRVCKQQQITDPTAIKHFLRERLPAEFCESQGW